MKSKSQKYEEAIARNLKTMLMSAHRRTFYKRMEEHNFTAEVIERVKFVVGIRKSDSRHDDAIRAWILS